MSLPQKIAIANRGEIATRIIVSCRNLNIKTLVYYSDEDRELDYVTQADESVHLEGATLQETYLNGSRLIEIAKRANCEGIHPGYGFLSENDEFAKAVEQSGLTFIGPKSEHILEMGDKIEARKKMQQLGIPLLPGFHESCDDETLLHNKAKEIGFPVLLKAASGGGGRAMRVCSSEDAFISDLKHVQLESQKLFGNSNIYLEKYLCSSKHLEVQVLSDQHGQHLHFFERDCSSQRRNQKVIEEAPAPNLSHDLRQKIYSIATDICKGINYLGAGTLEFIQDFENPENIYFLEMNTRIQVEHVVSEVISQVDLVAWQIRVAFGDKLPFSQSDLSFKGHAIEVRVYAEDPEENFFPCSGQLEKCDMTPMPQCRWDTTYRDHNHVSTMYDAMIGKLIVWDETRDLAIQRLKQALNLLKLDGIKNNRHHLLELIETEEFKQGRMTTSWIEKNDIKSELNFDSLDTKEQAALIAAHLFIQYQPSHRGATKHCSELQELDIWKSTQLDSFRLMT